MRRYDGVIFDMDGTLVEPLLDFQAIRRELGIAEGQGILETIEAMPPHCREAANRRLLEYEMDAARRARPLEGAAEVVRRIQEADLRTALLTRNTRPAMEMILRRLDVRFDLAWSREDGSIKPEPDGVLRACRALGIRPERTICVGDFHYDIIAANRAGSTSVLLVHGPLPAFADEANFVIGALREFPEILGL